MYRERRINAISDKHREQKVSIKLHVGLHKKTFDSVTGSKDNRLIYGLDY